MTTVLGVYTGHDQAACLLRDGKIVAMIEEERLTRVKHGLPKSVRKLWSEFNGRFGYFPWASVSYCLDAGAIGIDELDAIVLPEEAARSAMASILPVKDRKRVIVAREPAGGEHHFRHALSAFFASSFDTAAVLVLDGDGSITEQGYEAETGYLFEGRRGKWREVFKNRYAERAPFRGGLGWTYDYVSAILGFVDTRVGYLSEAGKTMGLAPYGRASATLASPWIGRDHFKLDFARFHEWLATSGMHKLVSFDDRAKALVQDENAISQDAKDLAWKVQSELEAAILHLAQELHRETRARDLCLAGGVALNSVANGLVLENGPFDRVFVQPAAHDAGQAIGLAYQGHLMLEGKSEIAPIAHCFGGVAYPESDVRALLDASGLDVQRFASDAELVEDAARELAASKILGWFQGGSEYGPRSLGHRSILADPRRAEMKDVLNARVKFREPFRPFAPSVLRERASDVFELDDESPFMLLVAPVRDAWRGRVPAITHVDGTARVQTVDAAVDPLYHALISAFAKKSEIPVILNTSFNLRGMPVVETPRDALQCFLYTEMDALYVGRAKVKRPDPSRLFPSAAPEWRLMIENELSWGGAALRVRFETGEGEKKKSVAVRPVPEIVQLLAALDGKRSFMDALAQAVGGRPAPEAVAACLGLIRSLLRAGAMKLRVGSVEL